MSNFSFKSIKPEFIETYLSAMYDVPYEYEPNCPDRKQEKPKITVNSETSRSRNNRREYEWQQRSLQG